MLYFSEPTRIWISAGIIIPILIHLAKGRTGKTLQIGSIQLIRENIISQSSSLKIRERLLLLFRCLGIILAAFFLSGPQWESSFTDGHTKGWILLEKNRMGFSLKPHQAMIDSLIKAGFELRLFENDFPKTRLLDTERQFMDTVLPGYWPLLGDLEKKVPAGMPVYLFTGNKLNRFAGTRPTLSLNLQWMLMDEPDSVSSWISGAYSTPSDSIRKITGHSRPSGTWFQNEVVSKTAYNSLSSGEGIVPDTNTLIVNIYGSEKSRDPDYVQTALEAVRHYTLHRIKISRMNNMDSLEKQADWIFWLSDSSFPVSLHPKNLFIYKNGEAVNVYNRIYAADGNVPAHLPVYRVIRAATDTASRIIWTDGSGRPLLTFSEIGFVQYSFYSRFDPAWNDLPWSAWFPRILMELLYPEQHSQIDILHDQRKIDQHQAAPSIRQLSKTSNEIIHQYTDLSRFFWVLLLVVFCLERFLSWKKPGRP